MMSTQRTRPFGRRRISWCVALFIAGLMTGCGGSKDGRMSISGTVTVDGAMLDTGDISLLPIGEGPSIAARIVAGQFKIGADKGPVPGKYRVSIESFAESVETSPEFEGPSMGKQVLPGRYNSDSELEMEVSESGKNEFTFELSAK